MELRLAAGVTRSWIMACNALENTIKQSITPTARRDTCSDAKESPFPTFFKGKVYLNPLNHCAGETGLLHGISPWGRFGCGVWWFGCGLFGAMDIVSPSWMVRTPGNSVGVAVPQPRVEVCTFLKKVEWILH